MSQREQDDRDERDLVWMPGDSYAPLSFEDDYNLDHDHDPDTTAFSYLRAADMVGQLRPSMIAAASRLGFRFRFDVPRGARSFLSSGLIHLTPTLDRADLQEQTGHELGHAICDDLGVPKQRQEPLAERFRISMQMPDWGILTLRRHHGWSPQMNVQMYKHVCPPTDLLKRAAYIAGVPMILRSNVTGRTVVDETAQGRIFIELSPKEEARLVDIVRTTRSWYTDMFGVRAYPWKLGMHHGIAITINPRSSLSRIIYGYDGIVEWPLLQSPRGAAVGPLGARGDALRLLSSVRRRHLADDPFELVLAGIGGVVFRGTDCPAAHVAAGAAVHAPGPLGAARGLELPARGPTAVVGQTTGVAGAHLPALAGLC